VLRNRGGGCRCPQPDVAGSVELDLLRQAVGDKKLNYVGFSYGTLLGATHVNMFPRNARAIVLDGNVDPQLRLTNGLQYDRERTQGFEIALDPFLKRRAAEGTNRRVDQQRAVQLGRVRPDCPGSAVLLQLDSPGLAAPAGPRPTLKVPVDPRRDSPYASDDSFFGATAATSRSRGRHGSSR
jgi:pimeloyl-ACP methyl ester carboxylesterase